MIAARHQCWADAYVVEEARRNLVAKAPEGVETLYTVLARINVAALQASGTSSPDAAALPEKERPVLLAAIRLDCEALVTEDRTHFGAVYGKSLGGVVIHSPRSIAEALLR